ncbi:hypothetical protein J4H86_02525 [Spiractinospora alimapuensis]|uniref:hypothetical protein n=1 Tax=Spiractinospora alimapuensis TaxID=2820884 RepID=UPI001F22901B|nr:hypothetical protein [Spiractinospora alimapuensis]QVQ52723.1 hypothetical protein J4H86_02525 [Spiractinospora alimapuensis]
MVNPRHRVDGVAAGVLAVVGAASYLQATTLARSIALWDVGLEHQRLESATMPLLGTGAAFLAAAMVLLWRRKPRAAGCVAPAALLPPALALAQVSAGATFLVSLATVSLAVGGAAGAVLAPGRPARRTSREEERS